MKLINRELVPGTKPKIYIGHRPFNDPSGTAKMTTTYFCEYCHFGRRRTRSLKTSNKQLAIRRAHEIINHLDAGDDNPVNERLEIADLARQYLEMQRNRSRAPTTITKYKYVLATFVAWAIVHVDKPAAFCTEQHFWQWHRAMIDDGCPRGCTHARTKNRAPSRRASDDPAAEE